MMAGSSKVIKVQRLPRKEVAVDPLELLAELCYYYPAYTLDKARRLPNNRAQLLIRTARKLKAAEYFNLTQIVAAPHTEKGEGVNELLNQYKDNMNGEQ